MKYAASGLCVLLVLCLLARGDTRSESFPIKVIGQFGDNQDEFWIQPYSAPHFTFRLEQGPKPTPGPLNCTQKQETRVAVSGNAEFHYPTVVLTCENGIKMTMTGLDFRH